MIPFEKSAMVDLDGGFRLCVSVAGFTARLDDGNSIDVARKYYEWIVDSGTYTLERLRIDMSSRVKWGKRQEPQISQFDMRTVEERKLEDDNALSIALPEMKDEKKMMLFVDVVEKAMESVVTVGESGNGNDVAHGSGAVESIGNVGAVIEAIDHGGAVIESVGHDGPVRESVAEAAIPHVIDWDTLEITPILEHRIGEPVAVMNDEEMYKYLGLQAEDEQAEQARVQAENETNVSREDIDLEGAELPVHDNVPGEEAVEYDREDPPMAVGTTYASVDEFRAAVRQHEQRNQLKLFSGVIAEPLRVNGIL